MGNLLSHFYTACLRELDDMAFRIKTAVLCSSKFDKNEVIRLAPVILKWLDTVSDNWRLVHPEESSLVVLLQSAFQAGNIGEIFRISYKNVEALDVILMVSKCTIDTLAGALFTTYPRLAIYLPK